MMRTMIQAALAALLLATPALAQSGTPGNAPLAPGGLVMQCPLAVRYVIWDRQVLQPAAQTTFGSRVARVENYGSYSCRRLYGRTDESVRPSEHARANALDVAAVTLEDGRTVSVAGDWDGEGGQGVQHVGLLRGGSGHPVKMRAKAGNAMRAMNATPSRATGMVMCSDAALASAAAAASSWVRSDVARARKVP